MKNNVYVSQENWSLKAYDYLFKSLCTVMKGEAFKKIIVIGAFSKEAKNEKSELEILTDEFDSGLLNFKHQESNVSDESSHEYDREKKKYEEWKRKMDEE